MDITLNPTTSGGITIGAPAPDLSPEQFLDHLIDQGRYAHNLRVRIASTRVRAVLASHGVASVQVQAEGAQGFYVDSLTLTDGREITVGRMVAWVTELLLASKVTEFNDVATIADACDQDTAAISTASGSGPDLGDLLAEFDAFVRFGSQVRA